MVWSNKTGLIVQLMASYVGLENGSVSYSSGSLPVLQHIDAVISCASAGEEHFPAELVAAMALRRLVVAPRLAHIKAKVGPRT